MEKYLVVGNRVLPEDRGRDETHFVSEIGRTIFDQIGKQSFGHPLKPENMTMTKSKHPVKKKISS